MSQSPLSDGAATRVWLPFAVVTLIWGSTWLVIVGQLGIVPPSWSVTYRFALGSAAIFATALLSRAPLRLAPRDQLFVIVIGLAQFVLNFNFVYRAEQHITSGLVAVVFALLVVPNAIGGRLFFGQELSRQFVAGSAIALGGMALLFLHEVRADRASADETMLGIGLTLAAVLSASIANVMQASEQARALPMPTLLAWGMAWGALIDGSFAWITTGPPVFEATISYVAGLLYLGLIASALAFTLYFNMIRRIGPARAAYSSVLIPVVAMALSTVFEGYVWSPFAALGAVLVFVGLIVAVRARNPAR